MEINSSLLNYNEFRFVKESLMTVSEIDHKENFRVKLLEYINDSSYDNDDQFFYDMLIAVRFLDPNDPAVAYTTPDKLICLNSPGIIGENVRYWDFIYDHECLHQLWDTFGVADEIKKNNIQYNHNLLNIASDCVINDYLSYYRKKPHPEDLITPESLKDQFDVDYNRKVDTQYTLYLKLIDSPKKKELEEMYKKFEKKMNPKSVEEVEGGDSNGGQSESHSKDYIKGWTDGIQDTLDEKVDPKTYKKKPNTNDYNKGYNDVMDEIKKGLEEGIQVSKNAAGGNSGSSSDLPEIPWDKDNKQDNGKDQQDQEKSSNNGSKGENSTNGGEQSDNSSDIDDMSANEAANDAQKSADKAKEAAKKAQEKADDAKKSGDKKADDMQKAADKAKEAAKKAQEEADKAKDAVKNGDKKSAQDHAKNARKEAQRGSHDSSNDDSQEDTKKCNKGWSDPNKKLKEVDSVKGSMTDTDIEKLKENVKDIIDTYKGKISGMLGEFVTKCKASSQLKPTGLAAPVKGGPSWNAQMKTYVTAFAKKKVFQKKRQYESTYSRVKRGSGFIQYGEPIKPGKKIKEQFITINAAFYIDRSGSMTYSINNVYDACYTIAESLKKHFSREHIVDKIAFKLFAFNDDITEIEWGKRTSASGCNVEFCDIVEYMGQHTKEFMMNIVITDAQFDINKPEVKKFMKGIDGMLLFITNNACTDMKELSEEMKGQVYYILADPNFTIK